MAVHSLSVKKIISRVRQVFPNASENYIINLINDGLVEIGNHHTKIVQGKISTVANQLSYNIGDESKDSNGNNLEANKVFRVDLMDSEGDYIRIPRQISKDLLLWDATNESAINEPDSK